jgi:phospholipase/lecithinase/hemolysin
MYSPLIILLICAPALALGSIFSRSYGLVVFGDSDSDTGNVYALTHHAYPISPPYYLGRYCNGPNWVDDMDVLIKADYAYGSATTDSNFVQGLADFNQIPVPGVLQQVNQYFSKTNYFVLQISFQYALHVVWAGANDFLFNTSVTPQQIVNSLSNSLAALLNAGVKNLLVFNQPPGQYTPFFSALGYATSLAVGELAQAGNIYLNAALVALKKSYPTASIYMFDTHSLITSVLASNQFINNNTACWTTYNATTVIKNCPDPTKYVFVDALHFSSTVEKIIADAVQPFFSWNFDKTNPGPYIIPY